MTATDERFEQASQVVTITINGSNDALSLNPVDQIRNHTDGAQSVDLSGMLSDVDSNDSLSFSNLTLIYPDGNPVTGVTLPTLNGASLDFDTSLFGALADGTDKRINVSVDASDGTSSETLSFSITIEGGDAQTFQRQVSVACQITTEP